MPWIQVYDPLGNAVLSTLIAALPIVLLLTTLALLEWKAHWAALAGLVAALLVSTVVYGMPVGAAAATAVYGAAYGLFPIGWIILAAVFLYNLTVAAGQFDIVKASVARLSSDRRIQALLVAFSFGAFIEGAAGFGTPVAITAALLMGLGFTPLYSAGLSLIANTAPVAYGAIGTPILTLGAVTGISPSAAQRDGRTPAAHRLADRAGMARRHDERVEGLARRVAGGAGQRRVVCDRPVPVEQLRRPRAGGHRRRSGLAGVPRACSARSGARRKSWDFPKEDLPADKDLPAKAGSHATNSRGFRLQAEGQLAVTHNRAAVIRAWMPWVFLSVFVTAWGAGPIKAFLNGGPAGMASYNQTGRPPAPHAVLSPAFDVPSLHRLVFRDYPVEATAVDRARIGDPAYRSTRAETARFNFNWLSATGTAILGAALMTILYLRIPPRQALQIAGTTFHRMRAPLMTIAFMLSLGFVTRYGGTDATLGLAFTRTGVLYPFFAAMLGWLGVALTGSDTSSNVLFGSLQKITAQQLGLNPILITTANSTGGVMGKMIDAQSIVVATAATNQQGQEGRILRFVFWHSVALATIMGIIVMLQAYVFPWMVPEP